VRMKRLLLIILLTSAICCLTSCEPVETQPSTATARLRCSPTGDNGATGCASVYDLRFGYDSAAIGNVLNWATQNQAIGEPVPRCPSPTAKDTFVVSGLPSDTVLFFALRVGDEAGNWSVLSNVRRVRTLDVIAPGPVIDLEGI
jgi:hypothetical protein